MTLEHHALLSPLRVQRQLSLAIQASEPRGPHTALLITPSGQILAWATRADDEENEADHENDEPWLDTPERLRLLLGLASQWEEDESPRVECELGRLLLTPINLPIAPTPAGALLPNIRPSVSNTCVLVLNGPATAPWNVMSSKMTSFRSQWSPS